MTKTLKSYFEELFKSFSPERVEVGQVWKYSFSQEDPFVEPDYVMHTVLEIKGEYVKYRARYLDGVELTSSCDIEMFKLGSERIT